jgi:phosphoserine phosphatase
MATIAIDIDDTLYSFTELARQTLARLASESGDKQLTRAAYAPWSEWRTPPDILTLETWLEIIGHCHDPDMILRQTPLPGAREVLWELVEEGHDLVYISDRAEELVGPTRTWLEMNDLPSSISWDSEGTDLGERAKLLCVRGDKNKHLTDCQYMIDDRPKNLVNFVYDYDWKNKHGSKERSRVGFGLLSEYNRSLTDVPGIKLAPSWELLRRYLIEEGLLRSLSAAKA